MLISGGRYVVNIDMNNLIGALRRVNDSHHGMNKSLSKLILSCLLKPPEYVTIDISFVRFCGGSDERRGVVDSILRLDVALHR